MLVEDLLRTWKGLEPITFRDEKTKDQLEHFGDKEEAIHWTKYRFEEVVFWVEQGELVIWINI